MPKKQSKILAGVKHEEEVGAKRAKRFMEKCDLIDQARKRRRHGSIGDKDLSKCHVCITNYEFTFLDIEIEAQDWERLYEQNYQAYAREFLKGKELEEKQGTKMQNYIFREQEYRKVI